MNTRSCFTLLATAFAVALPSIQPARAADEKPVPPGSIRPAGKVAAAALPGLARVTFDAALKAALVARPGSAIKGELEVEDGSLVYSFEIITADQKTAEVEIDAGNGAVLANDIEVAGAKDAKKSGKEGKSGKGEKHEKKGKNKGHDDDDDDEKDGDKKK